MKTSIQSLFALAFAFVTLNSFAAPRPAEDPKETARTSYTMNVFKGQQGKVNFMLEKVAGKKLTVSLRNAKGDVLFSENISKNATGYARRFDMNELADGQYHIEVTDGETTLKKDISINTDKPTRMVFVN
ncbi:hypothetical protein BWI97_23195 [Siphonobacter sp. BAB-5405]|uniref:hypothetical protein n=1 Tax=Siphonobacter sp. BAB-5405 TaxID=1864825 RepID=UPI000C7FF30D|nr:hypothetical protein [Siphonobacter sp. BAB-5405]PMD90394.1 hypothetical protein BWI97_23195 [Siphonobacter sp. BAB-5405]